MSGRTLFSLREILHGINNQHVGFQSFRLKPRQNRTEILLERLDRGELDLAVCSQLFPDSPFFSGLETLTLASEKLVGLIPLAGAWTSPIPNQLRDYVDLPFVGLDRNDFSDYWRFLDRICEKRAIRLQPTLQVKEKHALMMLVAGGMGVSILPAHVAESVPGTLRVAPIPDLTEEIPIVAAFQRHSQNSMLPAFLQILKECRELRTGSPSAHKIELAPQA